MTDERRDLVVLEGVFKRREGRDRSFELTAERLAVPVGGAVAFVGPSGSGKSTLIDLLAMTLRPDGAQRFVFSDPAQGRAIDVMALWRRRRLDRLGRLRARHFGYVMQTGGLLPFLSVYENIALPQKLRGRHLPGRIWQLADRLGIAGLMSAAPAKLSVGQRQRVAIARALAHDPDIVLADEPTASLDPVAADAALNLFIRLVGHSKSALVIATHDRALVSRFDLPIIEARTVRQGIVTRTTFAGEDIPVLGAMPA